MSESENPTSTNAIHEVANLLKSGDKPAEEAAKDKPQGDPAPEATTDEELGEGGKKALEAERNARKELEKRLNTATTRLAELERANESESERAQRELDPFRRPRRDQHPIGRGGHAVGRVVGGHRFARFQDAGRRQVAVVPLAHGARGRFHQVGRRRKAGGNRIADVEVADGLATSFHGLRFRHDVADRVGEPVHPCGDRN